MYGSSDDGQPIDVRLDLTHHATSSKLRFVVASAHCLGQLTFLPPAAVEAQQSLKRLPKLVSLVRDLPGMRIAMVTVSRVLVHDTSGVTPIGYATLSPRRSFPYGIDELRATYLVHQRLGADWGHIVDGVMGGRILGIHGRTWKPPTTSCTDHPSPQWSSVHLLDVDATGITLARVTGEGVTTVYLPFTRPVTNAQQLDDALHAVQLAGAVGAG